MVMLVLGTACAAGCAGGRTDRPAQALPAGQAPAAMKTCSQLGGDICTAGEECSGSWLNSAQDSFSCCSKPCSGAGISGPVVMIEIPGPAQTYEELESIRP
jgi:hypothetical protein